jgi:hypothetical protein
MSDFAVRPMGRALSASGVILSRMRSHPAASTRAAFLPADRATAWNPGLIEVGGILVRSTICSTPTPRGGALDDTAQIQAAINTCPAGQVVQLAAGTFIVNSGNFLPINKGIIDRQGVLGASGQMAGWVCETTFVGGKPPSGC